MKNLGIEAEAAIYIWFSRFSRSRSNRAILEPEAIRAALHRSCSRERQPHDSRSDVQENYGRRGTWFWQGSWRLI